MKYIVDVDALKECMGFVDSTKINGDVYVSLENIKAFIDAFPKTQYDFTIPPLMVKDDHECGTMLLNMERSKQDSGNKNN